MFEQDQLRRYNYPANKMDNGDYDAHRLFDKMGIPLAPIVTPLKTDGVWGWVESPSIL